MENYFLFVSGLFLFILFSCNNKKESVMEKAWIECGLLEEKINAPTFPDKTFNILDYGAKADDSLFLNTSSIDQAITACHAAGGGKVLVPDGTFYTGPVTLKSNVNLHIEKGGILKFSTDTSLYLPAVFTRWEGVDCYNLRPLIYAYGESNIALTGKGTIDGQASNENWWWMNGNKNYGWTEGMLSQKTEGRPKLLGFEQNKVPLEERVLTAQDLLRPQLINFYDCKNILLEDLTLTNSPFWVIHPLFCENMTVRSVQIISHGPNSDGCDPESSRNILIQDCLFDTGDDCIAIKSTRNNDGRTSFNKPSENIIVRGCKMKDGHGGVVVGSEISGGFRNLFVEDCFMDSPHLDRVIRIKTNTCRGGVIENIYVRNIEVGECKEAVLKINLQYEPREDCQRDFPPVVRNVYLDNITSGKSQYGVFIVGLDDLENVYNIEVSNSRFNNVEKGNSITGAHDVVLDEVYINEMDARDL